MARRGCYLLANIFIAILRALSQLIFSPASTLSSFLFIHDASFLRRPQQFSPLHYVSLDCIPPISHHYRQYQLLLHHSLAHLLKDEKAHNNLLQNQIVDLCYWHSNGCIPQQFFQFLFTWISWFNAQHFSNYPTIFELFSHITDLHIISYQRS